MLISSAFIVVLASTLYTIHAGVVTVNASESPRELNDTDNGAAASHKLNTIEHKLTLIDTTLQNLNEQAHTWAIFRHHIDSWNDQMKVLEHKLDLVKRMQDEQQIVAVKLTSFEFTLNHILSKLVLLTDDRQGCAEHGPPTDESKQPDTRKGGDGKRWQNEVSTRLGNILRHVQNIENDRATEHQPKRKSDNLMMPVREHKNKQHTDTGNLEKALKSVDQRLTQFGQHFSPKEFKQMHTLAKKNGKALESILEYVQKTDKHITEWSGEVNENLQHCQEVSNELTTFTASSDVLLKRIERLVQNANEKMASRNDTSADRCREDMGSDEDHAEDQASSDPEPTEEHTDSEASATDEQDENADDVEVMAPTAADDEENVTIAENLIGCHQLDSSLPVDGVYQFASPQLNEDGRDFFKRYCAQAGDDPIAWTVIQSRRPFAHGQQENFNRSWADYRNGFGDLHRDFWFGNEFIHQLVYRDDYALRVELEDFAGQRVWAEYTLFRLDSERYNYNLLIDGYSGNASDSMHYNNEMDFSTFDRRNDRSVDACCSCATGYASGWWFDNCSEANLNGPWHAEPLGHNYVGVIWELWHGDYSLKRARMMIRPKRIDRDDEDTKQAEEFDDADP